MIECLTIYETMETPKKHWLYSNLPHTQLNERNYLYLHIVSETHHKAENVLIIAAAFHHGLAFEPRLHRSSLHLSKGGRVTLKR
jgi:hypothetical protein